MEALPKTKNRLAIQAHSAFRSRVGYEHINDTSQISTSGRRDSSKGSGSATTPIPTPRKADPHANCPAGSTLACTHWALLFTQIPPRIYIASAPQTSPGSHHPTRQPTTTTTSSKLLQNFFRTSPKLRSIHNSTLTRPHFHPPTSFNPPGSQIRAPRNPRTRHCSTRVQHPLTQVAVRAAT